MKILGIDTSNYTTSVSIVSDGGYRHERQILEVAEGERGLRQSSALFLHTKNLPVLMEKLAPIGNIDAVAYSDKPRDEEGSYMPCFLAGEAVARSVAATFGVPALRFSHQAGHIMAAAKTCENPEIAGSPFLCYHVSGGTTELVLAAPSEENGFDVKIVGGTADISAGQLIDRAGVLMGLKFPCGGELEKLASGAGKQRVKISAVGAKCNFSGAENKVIKALRDGKSKPEVARYALDYCAESLIASVDAARKELGELPVLFAGGVMRNTIIREELRKRLCDVFFGSVELSSDNSVGTGWLGRDKLERSGKWNGR